MAQKQTSGWDLEGPVLASRCHGVIDLLDLWRDSPGLSAELAASAEFIGVTGVTVARDLNGSPAWTRKHTAPTRLTKQLSCSRVAGSRSIKQSDRNING